MCLFLETLAFRQKFPLVVTTNASYTKLNNFRAGTVLEGQDNQSFVFLRSTGRAVGEAICQWSP